MLALTEGLQTHPAQPLPLCLIQIGEPSTIFRISGKGEISTDPVSLALQVLMLQSKLGQFEV